MDAASTDAAGAGAAAAPRWTVRVRWGDAEADAVLRRGLDAEGARSALCAAFPGMPPAEALRVAGLRETSLGPIGPVYPLDVLARSPQSFSRRASAEAEWRLLVAPEGLEGDDAPPPVCELDAPEGRAALVESLRTRGWAAVRVGEERAGLALRVAALVDRMFALPRDEKERCNPGGVIGYTGPGADGREVFDVHRTHLFGREGTPEAALVADQERLEGRGGIVYKPYPWPAAGRPDGFREGAERLYEALEGVAEETLGAVAGALGVDASELTDRMLRRPAGAGPYPDEPSSWGCSLRLFKYWKRLETGGPGGGPVEFGADGRPLCFEHADTTLLTVAPLSTVPELEILDARNGRWCDVERVAGGDPAVWLVFAGTYLARLTAGVFPPALHRVTRTQPLDRVSMPYFYRPHPYASFDTPTLVARGLARAGERSLFHGHEVHKSLGGDVLVRRYIASWLGTVPDLDRGDLEDGDGPAPGGDGCRCAVA